MRFLCSGFCHKSKVPRPRINTPKYFQIVFADILVNSVLLSASKTPKVKIGSLVDPNFFSLENHNSIQVQMIHAIFISINLVLTALKLFKIGKFTLFTSQFTCRI